MIYELDPKIKSNPLIPWNYLFSALSIKQFSQVYETLEFPFEPPETVRQLAHDFTLTRILLHRNRDPAYADRLESLLQQGEIASINLLEGMSPSDAYLNRRDALFTNTFAHLERVGYAEAIYRWGNQSGTNQKFVNPERYSDLDALHYWCGLLRQWAVLEFAKQPLAPGHALYSPEWDAVVDKWLPIYTRVRSEPFVIRPLEPLLLSEESRIRLQSIVLHHEVQRMTLEMTIAQIKESPKSAWEDFAFEVGTISGLWIKQEGNMRIDLRDWNMILDALSADEMDILNQWALKDPYPHRKLKIPLPDFRLENA